MKPKLMICGYGRHGKDTVCEMLEEMGYTFVSSSWALAEEVLFPLLKDKYGYKTVQECYDDRANHRPEWYDGITDYNTPDLTALGDMIYRTNHVYCGIRRRDEFKALEAKGSFFRSIWVDASERHPPEDSSSCTVLPEDCNSILDNNGSIEETREMLMNIISEYERQYNESKETAKVS